ncbi:MAG: N-acetylneuraminate synthase family protein [Candidatus Omnitrophica bacterium]|nr:N-acetylneuraminate synthase family protein [Candidatus Omnitrophota bacterium]
MTALTNKNGKILIIAEIAQAHDGSLGILHSYIDALAGTGVDMVKFQTHIAEKESSEYEVFRVPFSYADKTRYDYWKRMSFSPDQWAGIKKHCEEKGMEFLSSPFSVSAVKMLEGLGVKRYKIASGETGNFLMLDYVKRTGKEIWLSTGMSSFGDISRTVEFIGYPPEKLALFQCSTAYPVKAEMVGLNVIPEMKKRFGLRTGLSDHSGEVYPSLAAVSLGADLIECHAVFDKDMFGPDSKASLTIGQFRELVKGIRFIERMMANPVDKDDSSVYSELKSMFGKSLSVNRDMKKGERVRLADLDDRKPGGRGIPSGDTMKVIGRTVSKDIKKDSFLKEEWLYEK